MFTSISNAASKGASLHASRRLFACATVAGLALAGCGGGGSGGGSDGPIEALSVADSMSVVTTGGSGSSASIAPQSQADTTGFAADCDYNTDVARSHVYDPSMDTLQTVNMILCLLKQTAYSGLLNDGVYKAQIDEQSCDVGGDTSSDSSETGQSSGEQQSFNVWVIESTRDSNTSDQIVEFWIPNQENGEGSGNDGEIRVRMTISKGVSDDNPFGVFNLDFVQFDSANEQITGLGNLHTLDVLDGFIGFSFYEQHGDLTVTQDPGHHAEVVQANVNMFDDQSQGVAHIVRQFRSNFGSGDSGIETTDYRIAFDGTHVLRSTNNDSGTCLSRTEFSKRTWRYNLYDAETGDRVELESGFGFQTEGGDYGWIGYYGLWLPPNSTLDNGDTVTRQTFGNSTAQTYTVVKAPGKLIQNTRHTLALTQLTGQTFEWWHFTPDPFGQGMANRFRLVYQDGQWLATAIFSNESHDWYTYETPIVIPVGEFGYLGMYSETLGGQVSYLYGDEFITYFTREFVGPSSELFTSANTIDFYGYINCLAANITGEEAQSGNVFNDDSYDVNDPYHYQFDKTTMALTLVVGESNLPVGLATGETYSGGPFSWGMQSGPLVMSTSGFNDTHEVWNQDVFYTYETGPNPWNQFATLLDDTNTAVVFDPPLQFSYTHTTEDDANGDTTFDGRTYLLNYNGPGNLGGIPNEGIDFDNDGNPDRYFPLFSIADGTLCGPTGTQYVLRGLESELTLSSDVGGCTLLTVDPVGALELPTLDDWTDPAIGAVPEVTDAPRVIEGSIVGEIDG